METRIDFETAKKFNQIELVERKTDYGDIRVYVRKGFGEVTYNVNQNFTKKQSAGEYIHPFVSKHIGNPLNLNHILNQEDVWLDIGGHLGFFVIRFLKQFPKIKKIVSYEALPHNVTFEIENLKLNGLSHRSEVVQKAIVPNDLKEISFFISTDSGRHSILPVRGRESITVPSININDAIKQSGATAIKMDVEGAEYSLIKAVTDWSNIRVAIIEWHFNSLKSLYKEKGGRAAVFQEIIEIFRQNGFDQIRFLPGVEHGNNFITHFAAIKTGEKESI